MRFNGFFEPFFVSIFDPQGNVTYDQAITMVMRALGYTEAGLNGTYPSAFVSKAVGLGALKGLTSGSQEANRADMAQLIFNVLKDELGKVGTDEKWEAFGDGDCMLTRLGAKVAGTYDEDGKLVKTTYKVVDMEMIQDEDTLVDLSDLFGQVISYYVNEDDQIVAVYEQITEPLTGTYYDKDSADGDGYFLIGSTKFTNNEVAGSSTAAKDETDFAWFENTDKVDANKVTDLESGTSYTFAVTYKGAKINKIYTVSKWNVTASDVLDDDALEELENDKPTILGVTLDTNDDDEIDADKFILNGLNKLDELQEGNVVYVYANEAGKAVKIDVGTKIITGNVTEITKKGKVTLDDGNSYARAGVKADTKYTCEYDSEIIEGTIGASNANAILNNLTAGNDYVLYLGYGDKVYAVAGVAETDYVVFLKYQAEQDGLTIDGSVAKIEILNQAGEDKVYELTSDYAKSLNKKAPAQAGDIVLITKNKAEKVSDVVVKAAFSSAEDVTVNSKGLVNSKYLKGTTVVFTYDDPAELDDADNWSIIKAETLFGESSKLYGYADGSSYVVAVSDGAETSQKDWVIITDWSKVKDNYKIKVLEDGTSVTYLSGETNYYTNAKVGKDATLYTLTLDSTGALSEAPTEFKDDASKTLKMVELATSGAIKISNGDFVTQGDAIYTLADDAIVYVYDISDGAWTTGTKSALSLKDGGYNKVVLYDTLNDEDELFNYAIVVKN